MTTTDRAPRPALALAALAAPVLWFVAELVSPAIKAKTGAQLDVIAADPGRWYAYTVLLLAGTVLFVPALAGWSRLSRERSPRLTAVATALLGYGTLIAIGDVMSQLLVWKAAGPAVDRAQALALLDSVDKAAGAGLVFATGGMSFLVGSVLLGVALCRGRSVPVWSGVAFSVSLILQLVGFSASSVPVIAASAVVALAAAVPAARALSGAPDRQPAPRTGTVLAA